MAEARHASAIVRGSGKVKKPTRQAREKFPMKPLREASFCCSDGRRKVEYRLRTALQADFLALPCAIVVRPPPNRPISSPGKLRLRGVRRCSRRARAISSAESSGAAGFFLSVIRASELAAPGRILSPQRALGTSAASTDVLRRSFRRSFWLSSSWARRFVFLLLRHHFGSLGARLPSRLAGFAK